MVLWPMMQEGTMISSTRPNSSIFSLQPELFPIRFGKNLDWAPFPWNCWNWSDIQWIGLRENLQETIDFPIKYGAFL